MSSYFQFYRHKIIDFEFGKEQCCIHVLLIFTLDFTLDFYTRTYNVAINVSLLIFFLEYF